MRNKILTSILCGVLALNLTACSLPFSKDKPVDPPAEKQRTPDQIFSLMRDKMRNDLKTANYKANINIEAKIDQEKLTTDTKSKINDTVLSLGVDRPHVLGIDNTGDIAMVNQDYSSELGAYDSPSIFNFGNNELKVKIDYNIDGKFDKNDENNLKGESNLDMEVDFSGMIVRFSFESKVIGDNVFVKVAQLPPPFSMMIDSSVLEKWWNINLKELEEEQKKTDSIFGGNIPDGVSVYYDEEKTEEMQKELEEMMTKYKIFKVGDVFTEEEIDGHMCYHYKIELNKSIIRAAFVELYDFIEEEFDENLTGEEEADVMDEEAREKIKEYLGQLVNIISESDIDVWIDKDEYYLRKSKFYFALNLKDLEMDEVSEEIKDAIEVEIEGEVTYSDINQEVEVEAPIEYESFMTYITDLLGGAQANARDAKRVSDVKQIQTALELFYNDNAKYADNLEQLVGQGYFGTLPENPKEKDGECEIDFEYSYTVESDNENYSLNYCISEAMGGIPAGHNTANNSGIFTQKQFVPNVNKNTDSDLDGLFDWEETDIYKTNPNNSDSDGDGYLDGDEVKKGYNPAGPGELSEAQKGMQWKEYDGGDFSIKYPATWEVDSEISQITKEQKALTGMRVQILSQYEGSDDTFRENILVAITDIKESLYKTVDAWNTSDLEDPDDTTISSKKIMIENYPGIDYEYTTEVDKGSFTHNTKFRDVYFIKDGYRYSVLFSSDNEKNQGNFSEEAQKIIDSFKLK